MNQEKESSNIVPLSKKVIVDSKQGQHLKKSVIKKEIYNSFNHSGLAKKMSNLEMTIGITSPEKEDGKTVVASNLAVSLALAYKKKTVLIDLNVENPSLHEIFDTNLKPGLVESFKNGSVFLSKTKLELLYLLPAGRQEKGFLDFSDITALKDIIKSLKEEFEMIIIDMGSVLPIKNFPAVFANEVDGMLMVLDAENTKFDNIERVLRHINKKNIFGFIFNKMDEDLI